MNENTDIGDNIDFANLPDDNDVLKAYFTVEDIKKTIKRLKNDKSPPTSDNILNEYFKYADNDQFISLICKVLNIVLYSGIFPDV